MDLSGVSVGMDVLISVLFGAAGAIGVWFKLKGKVDILSIELESQAADIKDLQFNLKDANTALHKRIDSLKVTVEKNREKQDASTQEIKTEMSKMELRIITAIHELRK